MSSSVSESPSSLVASMPVWTIDAGHSSASFSVKHMVVSTVRGRFGAMSGTISFDPAQPQAAAVSATVDATTVDTNDERRDAHLRSDDFFATEQYPEIHFESRSIDVRADGRWRVHGDLSMRGTMRPVVLDTEFEGNVLDAYGMNRAAFTATTTINRKDFGLHWHGVLEAGGAIVGDTVKIELNIAAVQQQ